MERQILHSTETVWEMLAREEWLGCRHDAHGRHTRVNTSVGTVYVFLIFNTKYIRIIFSKIYIYYERTLMVPEFVLAR